MQKSLLLIIAAGVAMLGVANPIHANGKRRERSSGGGWGGYGLYGAMFRFTDLNEQLKGIASDFTSYSDIQLMHGGGGLGKIGPVTIGGYGFGGEQNSRSASGNVLLKAHYGGGVFEAGWLPVNFSHFKLGPALGIGGAGFTLQAIPTTTSETGFDTLLFQKGVRSWSIANGNIVLAPTLNIIVPISWVGIALKAGYLWTPMDKEWLLADGPAISPAPQLRSSGLFASLQLIFGGGDEGRRTRVKVKAESEPEPEKEKDEEPEPEEE